MAATMLEVGPDEVVWESKKAKMKVSACIHQGGEAGTHARQHPNTSDGHKHICEDENFGKSPARMTGLWAHTKKKLLHHDRSQTLLHRHTPAHTAPSTRAMGLLRRLHM